MRTALLFSGEGRYADAWHPFTDTTEKLVGILASQGHDVTVTGDIEPALSNLATDDLLPDLVVFNIGLPRDGKPSPHSYGAAAGIQRILWSKVPVLAMHSSSTSFTDSPEWEEVLGGRWIRDVSMHPDYGNATIQVKANEHPITLNSRDFELQDERYAYLRFSPRVSVLAAHEHDSVEHPTMWAFTRVSGGKTVYDALGHDSNSYQSEAHTRLIRSALRWLHPIQEAG
ncbi:hypothetical protein DFO47_11223 [Arthrobacter sp. AG258]|uniref:ThuA domain-containing protein n=1 Tax=Arthrobacter sp. AG258 TaxID=2183899 RepID=UPI00105D459F|nr:ThuA domain-containing protein [Arthrobacter sp. AG258]TDT74664.1 hypothetical protein DFO47_11223 [Arthrobacter sp. AG258]